MRKLLPMVLFAPAMLLVGCGLCANEAPAEHPSPDGQWKYVSFDRNCGATTSSNLQISILPVSKSLPNDRGERLYWRRQPRHDAHCCSARMDFSTQAANYLLP